MINIDLQPVIDSIGHIITSLWTGLIRPLIEAIISYLVNDPTGNIILFLLIIAAVIRLSLYLWHKSQV